MSEISYVRVKDAGVSGSTTPVRQLLFTICEAEHILESRHRINMKVTGAKFLRLYIAIFVHVNSILGHL